MRVSGPRDDTKRAKAADTCWVRWDVHGLPAASNDDLLVTVHEIERPEFTLRRGGFVDEPSAIVWTDGESSQPHRIEALGGEPWVEATRGPDGLLDCDALRTAAQRRADALNEVLQSPGYRTLVPLQAIDDETRDDPELLARLRALPASKRPLEVSWHDGRLSVGVLGEPPLFDEAQPTWGHTDPICTGPSLQVHYDPRSGLARLHAWYRPISDTLDACHAERVFTTRFPEAVGVAARQHSWEDALAAADGLSDDALPRLVPEAVRPSLLVVPAQYSLDYDGPEDLECPVFLVARDLPAVDAHGTVAAVQSTRFLPSGATRGALDIAAFEYEYDEMGGRHPTTRSVDGVEIDPPGLLADLRGGALDCKKLREEIASRVARIETRLQHRTWFRLHSLPIKGEAEFADPPSERDVVLRIEGRALIALVDEREIARAKAPRLRSDDLDCTDIAYVDAAVGDPHTGTVIVGYGFDAANAGNTCPDGGTFKVVLPPVFFAAVANAPRTP